MGYGYNGYAERPGELDRPIRHELGIDSECVDVRWQQSERSCTESGCADRKCGKNNGKYRGQCGEAGGQYRENGGSIHGQYRQDGCTIGIDAGKASG